MPAENVMPLTPEREAEHRRIAAVTVEYTDDWCPECGFLASDVRAVLAELDATRAKLTAAQATIKAQESVLAKALKAMDDAATVRNYMTGAEGRAIEAIRAALAPRPSDANTNTQEER